MSDLFCLSWLLTGEAICLLYCDLSGCSREPGSTDCCYIYNIVPVWIPAFDCTKRLDQKDLQDVLFFGTFISNFFIEIRFLMEDLTDMLFLISPPWSLLDFVVAIWKSLEFIMSCRTKLSSVSFSDSRKGPSNPYILASASPQPLEGFDRSEAAMYRKSILGVKKKDKNYKRRNTLGSSNVVVEFLNEKECEAKIRAISHSHSQDDGALTLLMNSCHVRPKLSSCSFKGVSNINKSIEFDEKFRDANNSGSSSGKKKRNSFFSKVCSCYIH